MHYIISPEDLVNQLVSFVEARHLEWEGNRPWTLNVKAGLRTILQRDLTEVIFTEPDRQVSEFLLDVVAWDRTEGEGILLAAECEWESRASELVKDFEKLLVIKASTKLMIFASYGEGLGEQNRLIVALEECFLRYKHHVLGERYIFIDFAKPPRRKAFWFEVTQEGRVQNFIPISIELVKSVQLA